MAAQLREMDCKGACSKETPLCTEAEIADKLLALPMWKLGEGGKVIVRTFTARNFQAGMDFIVKAGAVAEVEGHHPDLHLVQYRDVRVEIWTHAVGGVTIYDFVLAAKIDAVEADYSPKWLKEQPWHVPASPAAGLSHTA
eukprot:CAMPEP_0180203308 /NCGR_PEP_ID=MMETSP0987-20121128/7783_1 /TAXON_ID=697907 /ORGANISM="non described non described, Strain CCMP2293" /LENGTH=139 /DNA_ID=CAMNT_0022158671 /DNA_START=153 /DNA_END=572 /DNA_ORIENTATION=+